MTRMFLSCVSWRENEMNGSNYLEIHLNFAKHCFSSTIVLQKANLIKTEMLYQNLLLAVDIEIILYRSQHKNKIYIQRHKRAD